MNYQYRDTEVVSSEVVSIGPELAKSMLEKNHDNRKLRTTTVLEYAGYMKDGLWRENGEPILLSSDGYILNGQHRLSAVIASGISTRFLVVTIKARDNLGRLTPLGVIQDRGAIRNHSDISGVSPFCDRISAAMIRELIPGGNVHAKNTALRASVYNVFSEEMEYFKSKCSSTRQYVSRAPVQSVFVLRLAQGYDYTDQYHDMTLGITRNETYASLLGRLVSIQNNTKSSRAEVMCLSWIATDPGKNINTKVSNRNQRATFEEIRSCFNAIAFSEIERYIDKK